MIFVQPTAYEANNLVNFYSHSVPQQTEHRIRKPFKESTQEREPIRISRIFSIQGDKLTTAVLVGIYTCVKFFRPFHSNGVVKNLVPASILSNPP